MPIFRAYFTPPACASDYRNHALYLHFALSLHDSGTEAEGGATTASGSCLSGPDMIHQSEQRRNSNIWQSSPQSLKLEFETLSVNLYAGWQGAIYARAPEHQPRRERRSPQNLGLTWRLRDFSITISRCAILASSNLVSSIRNYDFLIYFYYAVLLLACVYSDSCGYLLSFSRLA